MIVATEFFCKKKKKKNKEILLISYERQSKSMRINGRMKEREKKLNINDI